MRVELAKVTLEFPSGDIEEYDSLSCYYEKADNGNPAYYNITIPVDPSEGPNAEASTYSPNG